jgi:aryl-alcohol dehydrogenase-like predicted oxidoreductase
VLVPAMQRARDMGKLRYLGITETGPNDPDQTMLQRAARDGCWDVVMLAYNMMNLGARQDVFPLTRQNSIGTLLMFVVRNIFSQPGLLTETAKKLVAEGKLRADQIDVDNPLGFLVHADGARNVTDAAYRFVRHEPGVDVVLFGTGKRAHLRSNIDSILSAPLPSADVQRLYTLFSHLKGVGLDLPNTMRGAARG